MDYNCSKAGGESGSCSPSKEPWGRILGMLVGEEAGQERPDAGMQAKKWRILPDPPFFYKL